MTEAAPVPPAARAVLDFWFDPAHAAHWFVRSDAFDAGIRARFAATVDGASAGELDAWAATPEGWLALLIVLDQFRRNLHRDDAQAWACDGHALELALAGIARGDDSRLPATWRPFAYLPLEHAEDRALQARSVELFAALAAAAEPEHHARMASYLDYAKRHRDVIGRFGRFPHRNAVLGRASTADELEYLAEPGAGF